jgi:signal transduction histidine kinase
MLIEAGITLAAEIDLDTVLRRIVELAAELTGARYGAMGVLDGSRRISTFITTGISDDERDAIGHPPVGDGILGLLIDEARPIRIDDLSTDPRSIGFPPHHPPMHAFLGAPVKARGKVFGNLYLTKEHGATPFDAADEAALEVLATQAGVAIENARLYEEMAQHEAALRRLEVFEERERIAQELHDGVIQALFAVGMGLQGAAASTDDASLRSRLENAADDIDRTIRDLRNYIFGLRPGILADRQLDQAIHEVCDEFERRTGVVAVAQVDAEVAAQLASRAADVIQVIRVSLANVARHAEATTCRVTLLLDASGRAEVTIDDDGIGFDPGAASAGMGLENLRSRVQRLGGEVQIRSEAGEGSTVTATLPM